MSEEIITIPLTFNGITKQVPIHTVVTRSLMRRVEPAIARLRSVTVNKAFTEKLVSNPRAMTLMSVQGAYNSSWHSQQIAEIKASKPDIEDEELQGEVSKRFLRQLSDEFPDIWEAFMNPVSDIDLSTDEAINAGIELVKLIVNEKDLSTSEKEMLHMKNLENRDSEDKPLEGDGTNLFWDEQDLTEVVRIVNKFRKVLQR